MDGPDYELLDTFDDKEKAEQYANAYNSKHGYKKGQGFHSAVARTRKVREEE